MSSNRKAETTRRQTRQTASSASSNNGIETTATNGRNGRTSVRSLASDKKTYFVDTDDDDDNEKKIKETKVSPNKRNKAAIEMSKGLNGKATSSNSKLNPELIAQLEAITGLDRAEAIELLEVCDHSLEKAIELHFNGGIGNNTNTSSSSNSISKKTSTKTAHKRSHKEIDNDLNDAISISDDSNSQSSIKYDNDDNIRAPIAPTFGRLCDYDPYAVEMSSHKRSRVDGFRNMREEFNDSLATGSSRKKNFSTLFRPPVELLFDGSFEASKARACLVNKWVMINVQSHDDFACKCLNRDLWSDETVKEIIKANFVFNQVYFDSVEGQKLINIYNINAYPFIGIIDPRTGEKIIQLQSNKLDSCSFCEKITSFLCDFGMPNGDDDGTNVPSNEYVKVEDEDEVVVINSDKDETESANLQNGHSKKNKPQKATDILNNCLLNGENSDSDDIDDCNESYEDDTVISKEKYDKKKQIEKKVETTNQTESLSKSSSNQENLNKNENISNEIQKSNTIISNKNENTDVKDEKTKTVYQPRAIKYEQPHIEIKDCALRISYPNGDRLDFSTNGDSKLKYLTEYLIKDGFRLDTHELIERLMPNFMTAHKPNSEKGSILDITEQSRNLFHKDPNLTFKQLNLYPRVALLLQES